MIRNLLTSCAVLLTLLLMVPTASGANLFGPTPYQSAADIPAGFYATTFTELEDFEDDSLTTSISTASPATILGNEDLPGSTDSVDGDDGAIDGFGLAGRSLFCSCGPQGVTLTFPSGTIAAGLVWTDGAGVVTFDAFGPDGLLGSITEGDFVNASFSGETDDDRFFGATNAEGITALRISNSEGGIEIDHIQFAVVPEPSTAVWAALIFSCVLIRVRKLRIA